MICSECHEFVLARSRNPDLCKECEAQAIQSAAKQVDEKALNIAQIAQWALTGERPRRYRRAWRVW